MAFLIARSILSLGMDSALAAMMARRRRALAVGSGRPVLAASVMSRDSLENSLDRILSWRPLRCWMFLNFEWPAMVDVWCVSRREARAETAPLAPAGPRVTPSRRRNPREAPPFDRS